MESSSSSNAQAGRASRGPPLQQAESGRHVRACVLRSDGVRRSWCPEARLAEHREAQALAEDAQSRQRSASSALFGAPAPPPCLRSDFPILKACPQPIGLGREEPGDKAAASVSVLSSTKMEDWGCGQIGFTALTSALVAAVVSVMHTNIATQMHLYRNRIFMWC